MVVNNLRRSGSLAGSVHNNRGSCGGSDHINRSRDYSFKKTKTKGKKILVWGTLLTGKCRQNDSQPLSPAHLRASWLPFWFVLTLSVRSHSRGGALLCCCWCVLGTANCWLEYGSAWTPCSQFPKSTDAGDEESPGRARGRVQDNFGQRVGHVQLGSGDFRTPEYALRGWLF